MAASSRGTSSSRGAGTSGGKKKRAWKTEEQEDAKIPHLISGDVTEIDGSVKEGVSLNLLNLKLSLSLGRSDTPYISCSQLLTWKERPHFKYTCWAEHSWSPPTAPHWTTGPYTMYTHVSIKGGAGAYYSVVGCEDM